MMIECSASGLSFTTMCFMSSRTPAEDENSTAHTPRDVMLSASEASAFNSGIKQILRLRLRMTFKDRHVGGAHFSKERTKATKFKISSLINFLNPRALRGLRGDMRIGTWQLGGL
jgi:hypothetical protein